MHDSVKDTAYKQMHDVSVAKNCSDNNDDVLTLKNVSIRYEGAEEAVLNDVNFNIKRGTTTLITGLSGCGKSSLVHAICGLIPDEIEAERTGSITLFGRSLDDIDLSDIARSVSLVFQNPRSQFFTTNTTSELVFSLENFGLPQGEMAQRLYNVCERYGIRHLLDRDVFSLSMGERQLIALASSTIYDQQLIIFDEPSSNLDYGNTMHLSRIIQDLNARGTTCLVLDHRVFYLDGIISQVVELKDHTAKVYASQKDFELTRKNSRAFKLFTEDEMPDKTCVLMPTPDAKLVAKVDRIGYKDVLEDVSFKLHLGEVVALVGVNGAGKTTLASLLTGALATTVGNLDVLSTFYVGQDADYQLFGSSVERECHFLPHPINEALKDEVLQDLDLAAYKERHPFSLSTGEKQRLQIALARLSEAEFLIFDEPTSGLDMRRMKEVAKLLSTCAQKAGLLVITHDFQFIEEVATRVLYLKDHTLADDFDLPTSHKRLISVFKEMEKHYEI